MNPEPNGQSSMETTSKVLLHRQARLITPLLPLQCFPPFHSFWTPALLSYSWKQVSQPWESRATSVNYKMYISNDRESMTYFTLFAAAAIILRTIVNIHLHVSLPFPSQKVIDKMKERLLAFCLDTGFALGSALVFFSEAGFLAGAFFLGFSSSS